MSIVSSDVAIDSDLVPLEVGPDMTLADLKAVIQAETNISPPTQHLFHNNDLCKDNSKTLGEIGIVEGDMLGMHVRSQDESVRRRARQTAAGRASQPGGESNAPRRQRRGPDPEMLRLQMLGDSRVRDEVRKQAPELADAADDPERFRNLLMQKQREEEEAEAQKEAEIAMLNADPFNVDAQRKIEEHIRQAAVMENLQNAMEHHPEGENPPPRLPLFLVICLYIATSRASPY